MTLATPSALRQSPTRYLRVGVGLGVLAVLGLTVAGFACAAPAPPAWSLLPQPAKLQPAAQGTVEIADGASVAVTGADRKQLLGIANRFVQLVASTRGLHLHVTHAAGAQAAITFALDHPHAAVAGDAGYRIVVGDNGIRVTARTPRGLFYGSVTVWQLLTPPGWVHGATATVANGVVNDHPRFAWRGLLFDSGRHFQSVADIKKLIDWMSLNKLNVLLWHLTEDQGWRLEVPKYPLLTKIGACRKAVGVDVETSGSPDKPYCGFYTEADVRGIVRYAAERFVAVVPGIDLPGHSQAAVAAYPWLGVTGKRPQVWTDWGISPWLLKPDAKTLKFVDDVLDEVMRLFPSHYIAIGGDEAAKQQWNASPEVQAQMHKLGLKNMDALQAWFTNQIAAHLIRHGRTPVGWDDELVAGATIPKSEVVMTWHAGDHGRIALEALKQGHAVIMAPESTLYLDHYQSDLPDEGTGRPFMTTLQQVYDTAVVPDGANAAQIGRILGVQAQLWTELMPTFADGQHALFPRLAAMSEVAWSLETTRDWHGFLQRMPAELARYRALGIGYADSAFAPAFSVTAGADGGLRVAMSNQAAFDALHYTTDGSAPTATSAHYVQPLVFPPQDKAMLRAAAFAPDGLPLSAPRAQRLGSDALLSRDGNALEPCAKNPEMRLAGTRAPGQARPVYKVDVGNMCWLWPQAPLTGVAHVALTVGRVAWRFGDEAGNVVVRPKASAAGEFEIHLDSCKGPLLASLPLAPASHVQGQTTLEANVSVAATTGARTLCIVATGDPRDGQWTLARMTFSKQGARPAR